MVTGCIRVFSAHCHIVRGDDLGHLGFQNQIWPPQDQVNRGRKMRFVGPLAFGQCVIEKAFTKSDNLEVGLKLSGLKMRAIHTLHIDRFPDRWQCSGMSRKTLVKDPRILPHQGELFHAKNKKFAPTIVFVHHVGGSKATVKRHQQFVGELGFDSVSFNLSFHTVATSQRLPITNDFRFGVLEVWTEELHQVLTALPGKKIVYSFSMPSAAAAAAIAQRNATDVIGWITEGGPFVQLLKCSWNFFAFHKEIGNPLIKSALAVGLYAALKGEKMAQTIRNSIHALPAQFPVLSIRCWQDRLVPMDAIDGAFIDGDQLDLQIFSLPDGDHLQGLSSAPEDYKPRVAQFLTSVCQRNS